MTDSMIQGDWTFALLAVVFGIAAVGFWLDTTSVGKRLSGIAIMLVIAIILSNVGLIPHAAPLYGVIWSTLVPIAIPLLLLNANIRKIAPATGSMLAPFAVAVFGTVLGAAIAVRIVPAGPSSADVVGVLSATYICGSMNFVAVSEVLRFEDKSIVTATLAADNVAGTLFVLWIILLPTVRVFRRWIPSPIADAAEKEPIAVTGTSSSGTPFNLLHITIALTISGSICAAGYGMASALGLPNYGILFATVLSLIAATAFHNQIAKLRGHDQMGMFIMYMFFATIGAGTELAVLMETGLMIFALAATMLLVHATITLLAAKVLRFDLATVAIASFACVGGPAPPAAVAAARGWHTLTTPAIMCGVLGYAIANFLGVAVAKFLA